MESPQTFRLKEAAKILGVAPSALRYWDSRGIIRTERDPSNNYRRLSLHQLLMAGDIAFYRDLGVPIDQLEGFETHSESEYDAMLARQAEAIDAQIAHLQETARRVRGQRDMLALLRALEGKAPHAAVPTVERVIRMDADDPRYWPYALEDPQRYAVFIDAEHPDIIIDGLVDRGDMAGGDELWARDVQQTAIECLLETTESEYSWSNASDLFAQARAMGRTPRCIVGYYLIALTENGQRIERDRAWIICD